MRPSITRPVLAVALLLSAGCGYRYHTECEQQYLQSDGGGIMGFRCPGPVPYLTQSQVGVRDPATGHHWVGSTPDDIWNLWGLLPVRLTMWGFVVIIFGLWLFVPDEKAKGSPEPD